MFLYMEKEFKKRIFYLRTIIHHIINECNLNAEKCNLKENKNIFSPGLVIYL